MRKIDLPMSRETIESLKAYDRILLSGEILVGRDQVHARLAALINEGKPLPISLEGEVIYYMAPAATPIFCYRVVWANHLCSDGPLYPHPNGSRSSRFDWERAT